MNRKRTIKTESASKAWFRLYLECGHSVLRRKKNPNPPKSTTCEFCEARALVESGLYSNTAEQVLFPDGRTDD